MKRQLIAVLLIISMITSSFAATVSDNDGSAFITKAEFDSLKNNFQSQIDQFNSSIDSKIDAAIAQYLAGITVSTEQTLISLLSSDGKYGGYLEYWCSTTSDAFDTNDKKYSRDTFYMIHSAGNKSIMVKYKEATLNTWSEYERDFDKSRDYETSKKAKITLNNGTKIENALNRMRINTKMSVSQWEQKNYVALSGEADAWNNTNYVWGPSSIQSNLSANASQIHQGKLNIPIYTGSGWGLFNSTYARTGRVNTVGNAPNQAYGIFGYLSVAYISTLTNEVTYTYDKINVNFPLSTKYDLYWDPDDETSSPTLDGQADLKEENVYNYNTSHELKKDPWGQGEVQWKDIGPRVYTKITTPWCSTEGIKAKDEYLVHWNTASSKNRQVKNGMYLATTSAKGDLVIEAEATEKGKLYIYLGNPGTVIDNWTSSSFKGSTFDLTKDTVKKCEIKDIDKGKDIWMIFLPTNTEDQAILKINSMVQKIEN